MAAEVVKVDDKGRVLIPEEIRDAEGIEPGAPLQVVDVGGLIVLRKVELPSREEIIKMCREVRRDVYRSEVEPWLKKALKKSK
jgi:AbrB family looped-hinge helix DNA binding protein